MKMGKYDKNKGKMLEHVERKRKKQHKKNDNKSQRNKPESTGKRRKIKKILRQGKTIQTKKRHSETMKENSTNK